MARKIYHKNYIFEKKFVIVVMILDINKKSGYNNIILIYFEGL